MRTETLLRMLAVAAVFAVATGTTTAQEVQNQATAEMGRLSGLESQFQTSESKARRLPSTPVSYAGNFENVKTGCDCTIGCDCAVDDSGCDCGGGPNAGNCPKCGCCFVWGEHTWLKVGAGIRASYNSREHGNPNDGNRGTAQDFNIDNARLYFNGKGHKRIGFEFNTDINNAQNFNVNGGGFNGNDFGSLDNAELRVLDAILKFELAGNVNLWVGRMLPPSDRSNLDGPFYLNAWNFPFTQFGYPNIFQGRDDGVALWGEHCCGKFKWQVGVYEGENYGGPVFAGHPDSDSLLMAGRVTLNLLDPEPGYYNASTYYGEKNILALGASAMHRNNALAVPGQEGVSGGMGKTDYTGWNLDFLYEVPLSNCGVATLEAAYYDFNDNDGVGPRNEAVVLPPHGHTRQGESYFILGSYLFPRQCCVLGLAGRFQVLGRYQEYDHDAVGQEGAAQTEAIDLQLNYIMFGHNARISAVWTQLDDPKGAPESDTFTIGTQLQF